MPIRLRYWAAFIRRIMTVMPDPNPKPRCHWLRFSLRSLFLLVTAFTVALGWKLNRVHNQRIAVAEVERLYGQVQYDYQTGPTRNTVPPGPKWFKALLGDDFFAEVTRIYVYSAPEPFSDQTIERLSRLPTVKCLKLHPFEISANGLAYLARMQSLERLSLCLAAVTGADLAQLKKLKRLKHLDIRLLSNVANPIVTDDFIADIAALPSLKTLHFESDAVTDDGIARLSQISDLQELSINSARITDAGLEHLKRMKHLKYLMVSGPQFSTVGISHLARLTQLQLLRLDSIKLDDAGFAQIAKLQQLAVFSLSNMPIDEAYLERIDDVTQLTGLGLTNANGNDSGPQHLEGMTNLRHLVLRGVKMTGDDEIRLRESLPGCRIDVDRQ